MKKLSLMALLGMVSWALVGTPVQAGTVSKPGITMAKHKKKHHHKHKHHKHHKKA